MTSNKGWAKMETGRKNSSEAAAFSKSVVLGASGLTTPRMGIGADSGVPCEALEWAFDRGIHYFYWGSRRTRGMKEAIRRLAPRWREKMIIVLQTYDYTGLALEHTFLRGLKQLKIDYADAFILGMRNKPIPQRILDKALGLKDKGLVKHLCVSAHDRTTFQHHLSRNAFDLIMVRYNAAHRGAESEVFPLLPPEDPPPATPPPGHPVSPGAGGSWRGSGYGNGATRMVWPRVDRSPGGRATRRGPLRPA